MPGSRTPKKQTDQQCEHCGLYFTPQGITNHEPNCQLQDYDTMIQPLDVADHVEPVDEPDQDVDGSTGDPPTPGDDQEDVDLEDVQDGPDPSVVADGGSPAMDGPAPDPVDDDRPDPGDVDDDVQDEPDTVDCPSCGTDTGATADELEDGKKYRCTDCGAKWRWSDE